ncbi:MAG: Lcl C-terminal domain-containing protein, partial [Candidatus Scalindua sp.]
MRKFFLLNILIASFVFLSVAVIQPASGEVKLRTTYKSLYKTDHEGLKNLLIGKFSNNQKDGRIVDHNYKLETIDGGKVVIDNFTGLMWHQSGSTGLGITWQKAEEWVEKLNRDGYAGFHNWRLPTLEEAASLLKQGKDGSVLYIDPIFDNTQKYIWTGDIYKKEDRWFVDLDQGNFTWSSKYIYGFNRNLRANFVRP